jgi:hypothetical protein
MEADKSNPNRMRKKCKIKWNVGPKLAMREKKRKQWEKVEKRGN